MSSLDIPHALEAQQRREAVIDAFTSHDLREDLPLALTGVVESGECFSWKTHGMPKGMDTTTVSRGSLARTAIGANGYRAAVEAGVIAEDAPYTDYSTRQAIIVDSGPHGAETFAYDAETGTRYWPPRKDVSDLTPDRAIRLGQRSIY